MRLAMIIIVLLGASNAVLGAPYQTKSFISREVCQFQVDTFGGEHEVVCVKGDKCVDFPLVPHTPGIVALVIRKMLRKDVWQNGKMIDTSKTKLGICKRNSYQLPRTGKFVPSDLEAVAENKVDDDIIFPMGHNTICKDVNFNSEGYLVKDPEDCTKFYSCQRGFNGAYKTAVNSEKWVWLAYHMDCPVGTVFDGERCQIGFICQNIKGNFERQIQEEVKEREEEKRTANLEKDFQVIDFTETPVIIVDTSDIENEFEVNQNDQKSDNDQRIISTKTTSTIIKDIPNNEFAETKNTIPVESHSIRTTETIVKKIPTKTTSAITNELPDDDLHRMTIEASESVQPMAKNVTDVINTKPSIIDINEEEIQKPTTENVVEVSDIDSTSLPVEMTGIPEETSTEHDETPVITLLPEEFTTKVFKIEDNSVKTTTDVPVESASSTLKTFNIDIKTETEPVSTVTSKIPTDTTRLPLEITSNVVTITTMKDSVIDDLDEGSGISMDTTFLLVETLNDETTVVPVNAALLPTETTTDINGAVTINEERTAILPNNEIKTTDDETSTLNNVKTMNNKPQTLVVKDVTTETHVHTTLLADEKESSDDRYEDNSLPLDLTIQNNNIKTTTVDYETTVSPVFTTESLVETTKKDVKVTNNNVEALSRNDQTTLVSVEVEPLPTETEHQIIVDENENNHIGNSKTEILENITLSPTETTSGNVKDMTDETTVAYVDTTVSFAETTDDSAETINNEAEATAVNDETTNVPDESVQTTIHNINDSIVFKPVDIPHSLEGIRNDGLEVEIDGVKINPMHDEITTVPDATPVFTATGDHETTTSNIDSITRNYEATAISNESVSLFNEVHSTVKTTSDKGETTEAPTEASVLLIETDNVETITEKKVNDLTTPTVIIDESTYEPIETSTAKKYMEAIAAAETERSTFEPVEVTTANIAIETTTIEEIDETTIVPVKATTENKDIKSITTEDIDETTFVPVDATTAKNFIETTTTEELDGTTFVPFTSTRANKEIETKTTYKTEDTTLVPVEATTTEKEIETTEIVEIEETKFISGESSTVRKDLESTAIVEMEETTFMPVETEIVSKNIETTTAQESMKTTVVPVDAATAKKEIETTAVEKMETTSFVPVESSTARKDLESAATVKNEENIIIPENEIFLPFFEEEGSGSEMNHKEIVEEENKRREPRIMDDPVLNFLTYRTETSVSKVERV